MKRRFKPLILLMIMSFGFIISSCEEESNNVNNNQIIGEFLNWTEVPDLVLESDQSAKQLKASHDDENIYILVIGDELESDHQLFIDADYNKTTGFIDVAWKDAGFEYMVENQTLYKSNYNGSIWGWTAVNESVLTSISSTMKEFSIGFSNFEKLSGTVRLGFKDKTPSRVYSFLPAEGNDAALYVVDSLNVNTFTITTIAGVGGTIDPSVTVAQGESVTINVYPIEEDYEVKKLIVDGTDRGDLTSFTFEDVQADHTIEAVFVEINKLLIRLTPYLINYDHGSMDLLFRTVDTVKSVTVDWGTSQEYGTNSGELTVDDRDGQQRYQYRMDNLVDGQKYYYRVNVDTSTLEGSFYPAPEIAPSSYSFYALGDVQDAYGDEDDGIWPPNMGKDEVAHAVYNDIQTNPESNQTFVLHTGDLNDNYNWENWYGCFFNPMVKYASWLNRNTITIATQGNHDGANTDYSKFNDFFPNSNTDDVTSGGGYYSVDYGSVHLVAIDPFENETWSDEGGQPLPGSVQWNWLEADLKAAQENPNIKFTICFYHTGAYTIGEHPDNEVLQHVAKELFEPYGVDACLSGHNHMYSRGIVNNIYHLTLGSGGATQGSSGGLNSEKDPFMTVYAEGTFYTKFTVTGDEMQVNVIEHTGDGDINPAPIDSFTIKASDN